MTAPTLTPDRQQRLRDRLADVERQLATAESALDTAAKVSASSETKLAAHRKALQQAEQVHADATGVLNATTADRDRIAGDLATLRRRLAMADLVREARR